MSDFVYQDQIDPDSYVLDVTPGTSALDLSTVASAAFHVRRMSDNSVATWTASLSAQTTTTLTLTYVFVAGDIDTVKGTYVIYARLTLNSGKYKRTAPLTLVVKGNYEA